MKDRVMKILLFVVSGLLLLSLFYRPLSPSLFSEAEAKSSQIIDFRGNGVAITCSEDGRYVYAASSTGIIRSTDFGKAGTWTMVVENP